MGIQNKDGALYFATGIDNSGLYSGRQEAMGIIKAMAGEITAFDVFGGIGISAGIAFTQAAKEAYNFEKAVPAKHERSCYSFKRDKRQSYRFYE